MIVEKDINTSILAYKEFQHIDYEDCFKITGINFTGVNEFAKEYFLSQALWLNIVSQGMFSKKNIEKKIETSRFQKNTCIGTWKVFNRNENEIVFGDDMGFMEYRFSMVFKAKTNRIEVSTLVQYKSIMGKYYFLLIKFMHKKFIIISLENVVKICEKEKRV